MKKWITILMLSIGATTMNAQDISYGAIVGYNNLIVSTSFQGISGSSGESGLYIGLFADFEISEKFHVQPEVQYGVIFANNDTGNELLIPIIAKYYVAEKVSLQAGPQFDIILDESPGFKKLGLGLATGVGFDINEKLSATARYSFGLNNRLDEELLGFPEGELLGLDGITAKLNFFQIGLGYTF